MTDALRIPAGAAAAPTPAATERAAAPPNNTSSFQALLERLQRFAATTQPEPAVTNADDLRDAVRAADRSFTTAMDLRRQLEEAFQRHTP